MKPSSLDFHWRRIPAMLLFCVAPVSHASPFAYLTSQKTDTVVVVDLATEKRVASIPVGRAPAGIVVIDTTTHKVIAELPVPGGALVS